MLLLCYYSLVNVASHIRSLFFSDLDKEHSVWILVAVFSAFVLLVLTWTMNLKRNR